MNIPHNYLLKLNMLLACYVFIGIRCYYLYIFLILLFILVKASLTEVISLLLWDIIRYLGWFEHVYVWKDLSLRHGSSLVTHPRTSDTGRYWHSEYICDWSQKPRYTKPLIILIFAYLYIYKYLLVIIFIFIFICL